MRQERNEYKFTIENENQQTKKTLKRIKTFENDWDRIKNY